MTIIVNIVYTFLLMMWGGMIMMSPMMIAAHGFRDSKSSIITAMIMIGSPVLAFGLLHLLGYPYFGISAGRWSLGAALLSGLIILLYGLPSMLLNLQKGVPNSGYFSKGEAVYLDGRKIKEADAATFEVLTLDEYYAKDQTHVFFHGKVVAGADPKTFTAVNPPIDDLEEEVPSDQTPVYWKDAYHVYYREKIVEGADVNSFIHFAGLYAKDISHVYYQDYVLEEADPEKFRFIKRNSIGTDGTNLFIYNRRSEIAVDLESFVVIEDENEVFCKDKNNIYLLFYHREDPLIKVEGADLLTFKPLERQYAVDKDYVWFYGYYERNRQKLVRLEGVKPENFRVGYDEATDSEATDGKKFFMYGKEVKPGK